MAYKELNLVQSTVAMLLFFLIKHLKLLKILHFIVKIVIKSLFYAQMRHMFQFLFLLSLSAYYHNIQHIWIIPNDSNVN
jgi:hypothetical protein